MNTATLLLLGAAGGAVRGIMHAYNCMNEWLNGRQQYRHAPEPGAEGPPTFGAFYDVGGETVAAVAHTILGALVAGLLGTSGQVSGGFAVFAAGASAPLILVQLKNSRLTEAILGAGVVPAGPDGAQEVSSAQQQRGTGAPEPPPNSRPASPDPSSQPGRAHRSTADQDDSG